MIYILPTDTCFGIACALYDTKSYHEIYKIKNRSLKKPLAIMVESFEWLKKNTPLNKSQIEFLKNYSRPWTVLTNCHYIEMILNLKQKDFNYENREFYKKIAFRVANNQIEKELISEIGPIFLTSANFSGQKEIYDIEEAKRQFKKFGKKIVFLGEGIVLDDKVKPSDIFEFKGETTNIEYLRK